MEHCVLKENELTLVCDTMGDIPEGRRRLGLYYRDTRHLSIFELTINRQKPRPLASSWQQDYVCDLLLANPTLQLADGTSVLARTISIQRSRYLKDGLHERLTLYNYNPSPVNLQLSLAFGSDFRDIFEIRGLEREKQGTIARPSSSDSRLLFTYSGLDGLKRSTDIVFDAPPSEVDMEEAGFLTLQRPSTFLPEATDAATLTLFHPPTALVTWDITLEPMKPLALTLHIFASEGEPAAKIASFDQGLHQSSQLYQDWKNQCAAIETDNELFNRLLERSILDLRMLLQPTPEGFIPAAGIPWYCCTLGADSAITSLQTLMLNPSIAVDTLRHLAAHQGSRFHPVHQEEPGKIVHEMRKGEMTRTMEVPYSAYYGGVDATPLFLILFAETMNWLDDDALFGDLLPAARLALDWMERHGDIDGDYYLEHLSASPGDTNSAKWEDSRGAIFYPDGTPVAPPVNLVQVQGYAYRAMAEMSKLLQRKGETDLAHALSQRAQALKENFNRDFWLEKQRYFAQALDAKKRPVENVTSYVGHCLFCDIVDEEKARYVVTRLSSTEMASGWGICTVSRRDKRFNAMSYRNGSVWPHDNSLIVVGMKKYGYHWEVEDIATQLFEASQFFSYSRLPELFCGFLRDREAHSAPADYPVSCSPYAMAAGSAILLLQSMLGLKVDAAAKRIYLTPRLPCWLQHVLIKKLRIGSGTVNLHFDRHGDYTRFDISENEAGVEVVIPPH